MDWRFACYDLTDDSGVLLKELFPNPNELPHFVKEAQVPSEELPAEQWALVYGDSQTSLQKFAMVDRGNVWLSTVYFTRTAHQLPEPLRKLAARRLEDACEMYALEAPDVLHLLAEGEEAQATAPAEFTKVAHAIATAREQAAYAEYEEEIEADFHPPKEKVAAGTPVDVQALSRGLQIRMQYLHEDDRVAVTESLEKIAMTGPSLLQFVDTLDRATGIYRHWGSAVPGPIETVFGDGEVVAPQVKTASRVFHLGSIVVTGDDIEKLAASERFAADFPGPFVSEFREDPIAVFESLPKDTQVTLANIAQKC